MRLQKSLRGAAWSLIAAAIVLAGCTPSAPQGTPPADTPTPRNTRGTATPFPTLTPTTPGGLSTATPVPGAAIATPINPQDFPTPGALEKLVPFENSEIGYAISYPESWEAVEGDLTAGEPVFLAASPQLGLPSVVVGLAFPKTLGTLQSTAKDTFDAYAGDRAVKILSEGPTLLADGTPAYAYNIEEPQGNLTVGTRLVLVLYGSRVYLVVAQTIAGDFQGRLPQLDEITKSFKPTKPIIFGVTRDNAFTTLMQGPADLDPHTIMDTASYNYVVQIFSGLVALNKDLQVAPDLAERWDVTDGGKTYTFTLRANAKFHSGKAVTADDVKYSFERAATPATRSRTASMYLNDIVGITEKLAGTSNEVTGVQVVDARHVRIRLKEAVPHFLSKMTHPVAYVVERANVASSTGWYAKPDGTGPFKLRGWAYPLAVVLDRNSDYYRTPPAVPSVLIWTFGPPNGLAMYQAGEVDVAPLDIDDLAVVREPGNPAAAQLVESSELTLQYLGFNVRQAPFDDPRARRAFLLASDVTTIVAEDLDNTWTSATGIMPEGLPGYNPALKPAYDPTRAKALWNQVVAEKGAAVNTVKLLIPGRVLPPELAHLANIWQKTLGVNIEFTGALSADLTASLGQSSAHIYSAGWVADYPDPQNFLDLLFNSTSVNNYGLYKNTQFDSLLEQARTEQDANKRVQLYRQAESLLMDDAAAIPLWYPRNYNIVSTSVRNWFLSAQNVPDFAGLSLTRPVTPAPPATQA